MFSYRQPVFDLNSSNLQFNDIEGEYANTLNSFRTERLKQTSLINDLKEELKELEAKTKAIISTNSEDRKFPSNYILPTDTTERVFANIEEELIYTKKLLKEKEWALDNQLQINRKLKKEIDMMHKGREEELRRLLEMICIRIGANFTLELQTGDLARKTEEMVVWISQQMKTLKKKYEILLDRYNKLLYEDTHTEYSFTKKTNEPIIYKAKPSIHNRNSDLYYDLKSANNTKEYVKTHIINISSKVMNDISNMPTRSYRLGII